MNIFLYNLSHNNRAGPTETPVKNKHTCQSSILIQVCVWFVRFEITFPSVFRLTLDNKLRSSFQSVGLRSHTTLICTHL